MGFGPSSAGAAIITTYFLVLVFCAFLSVVFAFLLRRLMILFHAESLWQWSLGRNDSCIADGVMAVRGASRITDAIGLQGAGNQIAIFLFLGVRGIAEHHVLLGLPVAALNSAVLFP